MRWTLHVMFTNQTPTMPWTNPTRRYRFSFFLVIFETLTLTLQIPGLPSVSSAAALLLDVEAPSLHAVRAMVDLIVHRWISFGGLAQALKACVNR